MNPLLKSAKNFKASKNIPVIDNPKLARKLDRIVEETLKNGDYETFTGEEYLEYIKNQIKS